MSTFTAENIAYLETGYFSKIITDYLSQSNSLKDAIELRKKVTTKRKVLVEQLEQQYFSIKTPDAVKHNISALKQENTFTVCTAH